MANMHDVRLAQLKSNKLFEKNHDITPGVLVAKDYTDSTKVKGREGFKWVKELNMTGGIFMCFAPDTADKPNQSVLIGYDPKPPYRRKVLRVDWDAVISSYTGEGSMDYHGVTHEWPDGAPGPDVVRVYPRAITPFALRKVSALTVKIAPAIYIYNNEMFKYHGTLELDLTSLLPTSGYSKRILVYFTPSDASIGYVASAEVAYGLSPAYPLALADTFPVGWVLLHYTTDDLDESNIVDARAFFSFADIGGTPGSVIHWRWNPIIPPETANADDDEFDNDAIAGWSDFDQDGYQTESEGDYGLVLTQPSHTGHNITGKFKTAPSIPFSFMTYISLTALSADYSYGGLALWEDGTDASKKILLFSVRSASPGGGGFIVQRYGDYNDAPTGLATTLAASNYSESGVYLRMRVLSTVLVECEYSHDGIGWRRVYSGNPFNTAPTWALTHFGVALNNNNSGHNMQGIFRWFRVINDDVTLFGVVAGRKVQYIAN